jgi:hypothetical protein
MNAKIIIQQVKAAIRQGKTIIMADGERLSANAAKEHFRFICEDTIQGRGTWQAAGV